MNGILLTSEEYSDVIVAICALAGMCEIASNHSSGMVSRLYEKDAAKWDALRERIGARFSREYKEV